MRAVWKTILIILLTLTAYYPALRGGFIWDDTDYVTENQTLRDLNGLKRIWFEVGATYQYYPLVHSTFWLEYHLWKLNPFGFHLVNVLLHATSAILLWQVLRRLQLPGAWLAAAIFALHPVEVESVAWITERKNVLSGVFYFAAALAYLRFVQESGVRSQDSVSKHPASRFWLWYAVAFLLFVSALLSKTVACSLPAALLLILWWKKGQLGRGDVMPTLPLFATGMGLGLLTAWVEKHHVGAQGQEWALTFFERCLIAGRALWFYAGKLVWPANLTFIYPRWQINVGVWWQWLFPFSALVVVAALWFARKRLGRGPLVAVLFFAGTLFPALGFINVYPMVFSFVADHFQYLASVGLITLGTVGLSRVRWVIGGPLLVVLGVLTWQQTHIYRNLETLWRDTLAKNSTCWLGHNNLGLVLEKQRKTAEAEWHYREALKLNADYPEALNNLGSILLAQGHKSEGMDCYLRALKINPNRIDTLNNIGTALLDDGSLDEAEEKFRKALQIHPNSAETLNNLGTALVAKGQYPEAIACYEAALHLKPDQAEIHWNLGNALAEIGKSDEAVLQLRRVIEIEPGNAKAHNDLARALADDGKGDEAMAEIEAALRLSPGYAEAHYNRGSLLSAADRTEEAIKEYRLALRYKADYPEAHNNLGVALTLGGKLDEAVVHYTEALRLKPDYAEAHNNLGYVLARLGRRQEAIEHFRKALVLRPDYPEAERELRALGVSPDE